MAYPLEQGLKQHVNRNDVALLFRLNGLSTRTRIETQEPPARRLAKARLNGLSTRTRIETHDVSSLLLVWVFCLNGLSTRTRIETRPPRPIRGRQSPVLMAYPLEQGLKHDEDAYAQWAAALS